MPVWVHSETQYQPNSQPASQSANQNCMLQEQRTYHHTVKAVKWRWKGFRLPVNGMQKALIPADCIHILLTERPKWAPGLLLHRWEIQSPGPEQPAESQQVKEKHLQNWQNSPAYTIHIQTFPRCMCPWACLCISREGGHPPADDSWLKEIFLSQCYLPRISTLVLSCRVSRYSSQIVLFPLMKFNSNSSLDMAKRSAPPIVCCPFPVFLFEGCLLSMMRHTLSHSVHLFLYHLTSHWHPYRWGISSAACLRSECYFIISTITVLSLHNFHCIFLDIAYFRKQLESRCWNSSLNYS